MRLNLLPALTGLLFSALALLLLASPVTALDVDVEPLNMNIDPEDPVAHEAFQGSFEVRNNGLEAAVDVTVLVMNHTDECAPGDMQCDVVHDVTIGAIGADKAVLIEFDWTDHAEGDRIFSVLIDYMDDIDETDENNNVLYYEFHVFGEPTADLEFIEGTTVILSPPDPAVDDIVDVVVLFQNSGRASAPLFYVLFQDILDGNITEIETLEVRNVRDGSAAQVNITWQPGAVGDHTLRITLDSDDDIEETNEDNNVFDEFIFVHPHTPELTVSVNRGLVADPLDEWLELPFQNHAINLSVLVYNNDSVEPASDVRVRFWDQPEGGSASEIADFIIGNLENGTRQGVVYVPGEALAWITWDLDSGTSILGNHTIIVEVDPLNAIGEWNEDDNRRFFNVIVHEPQPDLEVTAVAVAGEPVRGIPSIITVSVINVGAETVSGAYVELRVDGELVNDWNITLTEGELRDLEYNYIWSEHNPTVMGYADPEKVVEELDESNNYHSIWVEIAAPQHDVQVGAISHSGEAFEGQWVELTVELQNLLGEVPHYRLSLFVDNATAPEYQDPNQVQELYYVEGFNLAYNESRVVSIWWYSTVGFGWHNLSVEVEVVDHTYPDLNLSDNRNSTSFYLKHIFYQLSLEIEPLPEKIRLNETVRVIVNAFNFGPEILSEGAEVVVTGSGTQCEPGLQRTRELERATGEDTLEFFCTPNGTGPYVIEARIDPDNIHDEPNEDDNFATGVVNVTNEEFTPVTPPVVSDDSFITQPIVWVPLATLAMIGAGMFAYYRLRGDDDFLPGTRGRQSGGSAPGQASGSATFRYDAESGITYDANTGEVIGEKKKD